MSENGEIYTAGINFTLPPAVTNLTSGYKLHHLKEEIFQAMMTFDVDIGA